ncbi:MAG: ImmA/IrrE family metallo-endopeptidase [Bacteroidia bacterium]
MPERIENINKEILEWAILRAGNDLDEFYLKNPKVQEWVEKESSPTLKQLEGFTQKVHVPFGYMFLAKPPEEDIPIPFFRSGKKNPEAEGVSLNVYHTIQTLQERQSWLTDYLSNVYYDDLPFVGKYDVDTPYSAIANDIKQTLGLNDGWANAFSTWEEALNYLTQKIEEAGVIVTFNGVVGNNTRRVISPTDCRGFVLVDKKAPFLFINSTDAKAAQMFTLVHELAHIWLGETAGFDNSKMMPANHPVELLCDKVAAEFLVPENYLRETWKEKQNFRQLARHFKVSQIVIARRVLDLKLISKTEFFDFYNNYIEGVKAKKENAKSSGGDFYATAKKRISLRFASFVNNAVKENALLYRDAYKLTTLKGNTYERFVNEHLYQV